MNNKIVFEGSDLTTIKMPFTAAEYAAAFGAFTKEEAKKVKTNPNDLMGTQQKAVGTGRPSSLADKFRDFFGSK